MANNYYMSNEERAENIRRRIKKLQAKKLGRRKTIETYEARDMRDDEEIRILEERLRKVEKQIEEGNK